METEFPERYIALGLKIAYYRKKAGYTQEVFAEMIDKSVSFLGQVEGTGIVRGISLETLFKIAQVLNIPPYKLLEDDELQKQKHRSLCDNTGCGVSIYMRVRFRSAYLLWRNGDR